MLVTGADMGLELSRIGKTQRLFRLVTRTNADQPLQAVLGASHELPFARLVRCAGAVSYTEHVLGPAPNTERVSACISAEWPLIRDLF